MLELLFYPTLAAIFIASLAGPLGSFVLWKRMAFFGDTLAHSVFLGFAVSMFFDVDNRLGIIFIGLLLALFMTYTQRNPQYHPDTLLSIFSHGSFGLGILALTILSPRSLNLFDVFFGDILAVTTIDTALIACVSLTGILALMHYWRPLLNLTVNPELALVDGEHRTRLQLGFMLLIALFVALSLQIIGALLTTALLITPAAIARGLCHTPKSMALWASVIGVLACVGGIMASATFDLPTGPMIVAVLIGGVVVGKCLYIKRRP